ncbi:hypothetical protein [Ferruginibacter sp. HRS2-29]|uniref:hypothetical protein n=1 Tax=Ferruginibacter sp. HRS2-29 TaxID=2487334 RepID=UPI0020CF5AEC|nr:hypothetical protein [Ferruginibacter sp. HRS2-29]MCP9752839.1 hypothetical protein [Ferruginibacter sp. HRS2-29]
MSKLKKKRPRSLSQSGNQNIKFGISKISLLEYTLDEPIDKLVIGKDLTYSFDFKFNILTSESTINIEMTYKFFHRDILVHSIKILTIFMVESLSDLITRISKDSLEKLNTRMAQITIGAARGIQSTIIKDTKLEPFLIPLIHETQLVTEVSIDKS